MNLEANKYNDMNIIQILDGKELIQRIINENSDEKYEVIMDIGCGSGNLTLLLTEAFSAKQIVAIDFDEGMISFAQQNNSKDNITYLVQDFSKEWDQLSPTLKSLEGKADLIFSNYCLHWIRDKENAAKNLGRLLSKTGKIYVSIIGIPDYFGNLGPEEKAIHENEFMKVPTQEEQFGLWFNVFKNNGLEIISDEMLFKEFNLKMKLFEEHYLPMIMSYYQVQFMKPESNESPSKFEDRLRRAVSRNKTFLEKGTGEKHLKLDYGVFQFALKKCLLNYL